MNKTYITDIENNELVITKFGQLTADARHDNILVRFEYNNSPWDIHTSATGSGTITNANSMCIATIGTGTGLARVRSTHTNVYHPAHEVHAFFTAKFTAGGDAGSYQRIGLLDPLDGYGIGMEGNTFCCFKRHDGVQTSVAQEDFNKNKLDGQDGDDEQKKRFNIDLTKINVFKITYGWLGISPCSFSVFGGQDRGWIPFHVIDESNESEVPTILSPSHHIHMECGRSASSGNTLSISTGSWCSGSTGERTDAGHRQFAETFTKTLDAGSAGYIGTISNISSYHSKANKIPLTLTHIGASTDGTKPVQITIYKNAVLASTSYDDKDSDSSIVQIDTAGSASAGSASAGSVAMVFPMSKTDTLSENLLGQELEIHPSETFTIVGDSIASSVIAINLRWKEIHA